jgi:hypothetical protein
MDEPTLQEGLSQLVQAELLYRRGLPHRRALTRLSN